MLAAATLGDPVEVSGARPLQGLKKWPAGQEGTLPCAIYVGPLAGALGGGLDARESSGPSGRVTFAQAFMLRRGDRSKRLCCVASEVGMPVRP